MLWRPGLRGNSEGEAMTMTLPARRSAGLRPMPGWGWVPGREFDPIYRLMMDQVVRDTAGEAAIGGWATPMDLEETEDAFLLEMDLPGVGKDAVTVDVTGHEIRISGEVKQCEHTGLLHHQTRRMGRFDQVVNLSGEVDPAKTEATLTNGVLTVRAPKAEANKPRKVEITAN